MDSNKQKHLDLIQGVISRMANSLFLIRGWSLTLITGILTLAVTQDIKSLWPLALFSIVVFWLLDSYFLSQERLYRKLYDSVRKKLESQIDFSMDTSSVDPKNCSILDCAFSLTIGLFYVGALVISYIIFKDL